MIMIELVVVVVVVASVVGRLFALLALGSWLFALGHLVGDFAAKETSPAKWHQVALQVATHGERNLTPWRRQNAPR